MTLLREMTGNVHSITVTEIIKSMDPLSKTYAIRLIPKNIRMYSSMLIIILCLISVIHVFLKAFSTPRVE